MPNSTQPFGKTHSLRQLVNRSPLVDGAVHQLTGTNDRFYKTRPRNFVTDPITGSTKKFDLGAREIEGFNPGVTRDRVPRVKSTDPTLGGWNQPKDRISGALRKEVPNVGYVNPFLLKANLVSTNVLRKDLHSGQF